MRKPWGWVALGLILVTGLGACDRRETPASGSASADTVEQAAVSASPSPEPLVSFSPGSGTENVRPDEQVVVTAQDGRLESVAVVTAKGKVLTGTLDPSGSAWRSGGLLDTASTYTVTAVAVAESGEKKTSSSSFTTLKPTSTLSIEAIAPGDGWSVGVGMPIMIQFSGSVKDRAAVERTLSVRSTPTVEGAWHWMNSRQVWWRPKAYWPKGTKVTMTAAINGAETSKGVWGRRSYSTAFTVGSAVISTVDVKSHTLTVTKDGKHVRTIPVTTGLPTDKYRTRGGTKVIMDKRAVETMDAASTGTNKDDPEYYNLTVKWAMRLTWSGEYLHAAPWSVGQQGRANVSHGCTGMSTSNAKWMFDFSKIGDVVVYTHSPRALEPGNGYTAWEYTWGEWLKGSALAGDSTTASPSTSAPSTSAASTGTAATVTGSSSSTSGATASAATGATVMAAGS
ncbi:MAG: Ig-like protein [Actinomycetota bacterium]|nr:Ig-like protein [Actinomycetota bacterium]